jgi:uncharacterized protein YjlB
MNAPVFRALGRELHRSWFLTWRTPVAVWHDYRADRHEQLAQRHRARALHTARRALELADRYPSLEVDQ